MARRKNTAEAFEILYRRSRERMSRGSEPPGEPTDGAATDGSATDGVSGASDQDGPAPGDRLPARRERSGAPLRPPRLLRRPAPSEPVLRARTGPRSLGRRLGRDPDFTGEAGPQELRAVRYPAPFGPYPGSSAPWPPARRGDRTSEWTPDGRPGRRPARRDLLSWLPRWLPSRPAREAPPRWAADTGDPHVEAAGLDPARGYHERHLGPRGPEDQPSAPLCPACHGPASSPPEAHQPPWTHRQTEYREADGYIRKVGDIFSAPGDPSALRRAPAEESPERRSRGFVDGASRVDLAAMRPAPRETVPEMAHVSSLSETEALGATEALSADAGECVGRDCPSPGPAAEADFSSPTASGPVGPIPAQALGPGGSPLRDPGGEPLRPAAPPPTSGTLAGGTAPGTSPTAGASIERSDGRHVPARPVAGVPTGDPPAVSGTPTTANESRNPDRSLQGGVESGGTPVQSRPPGAAGPTAFAGPEVRAVVFEAARRGARWLLGDGFSELLGRRIEVRAGTLVGIAMVTVVVGALLIASAEVRRENEVYDSLFPATAGPGPDSSTASKGEEDPSRRDSTVGMARSLQFPLPMPLLGPMAERTVAQADGPSSSSPAAGSAPGQPLEADAGDAAAPRSVRSADLDDAAASRPGAQVPRRRYNWFVRVRGMCYREEAEGVIKYFSTRLGYACRMEPETREGQQETREGRPLFVVVVDEVFPTELMASRVCDELKRRAAADPYEKAYMRNFEQAYALRREVAPSSAP